jgi:hypothetical protein
MSRYSLKEVFFVVPVMLLPVSWMPGLILFCLQGVVFVATFFLVFFFELLNPKFLEDSIDIHFSFLLWGGKELRVFVCPDMQQYNVHTYCNTLLRLLFLTQSEYECIVP